MVNESADTDRDINRQTNTHTQRDRERQWAMKTSIGIWQHIETDRETDRLTETDRHRETETHSIQYWLVPRSTLKNSALKLCNVARGPRVTWHNWGAEFFSVDRG